MTTSARTDIHRPSAPSFDPEAYEFTGAVFDLHPDVYTVNELAQAELDYLLAEGFVFSGVNGGRDQCDHCGAHLRYAALLVHQPTQTLIYVGETCLSNRFEDLTRIEFRRLQAAAKLARELALTKAAFEIACEDNQALAYATYAENIEAAAPEGTFSAWAIDTLADIARKARQYGSPTSRQADLVERIVGELEAKETAAKERFAARTAEQAARVNAFIGTEGEKKHQFDGVVRFILEYEDNGYGASVMILIDTPEGTVKWTSGTDKAWSLAKGDKVSFTATIKAHEIYRNDKQTIVLRPKFA
jgi:hypothetical protein